MRKFEKIEQIKRLSIGGKVVIISFIVFSLFQLFIHVYPFFFVLNNSLKTADEIYRHPMAITTTFSFENYKNMINKFIVNGGVYFEEMLWNSIWQTGIYILINVFSSASLAYIIAKYRFPGRDLLYGILIFIQTIPIIGKSGATFKLLYNLNFINNPSLIWIYWGMGFDYTAFVLYGTFKGISATYLEAAKIDGAGDFKVFFKISLPMMFPSIIAVSVSKFLTMWNNYTISQVTLTHFPNLAYGLFAFQRDAGQLADGETLDRKSVV